MIQVLEVEHARVFGAYKEKIDLKAKLLVENAQIIEETNALKEQIAKENSGLAQYQVSSWVMLVLILIILSRRDRTKLKLRWKSSKRR